MGQLKRSCETQIHCWAGENSTSGINLLGGGGPEINLHRARTEARYAVDVQVSSATVRPLSPSPFSLHRL